MFENSARGDHLEARNILNAQLAFQHKTWTVTLYGTNLTDETTYGGDTVLPDLPLSAAFGGDGPGPRPLPLGPRPLPLGLQTPAPATYGFEPQGMKL